MTRLKILRIISRPYGMLKAPKDSTEARLKSLAPLLGAVREVQVVKTQDEQNGCALRHDIFDRH